MGNGSTDGARTAGPDADAEIEALLQVAARLWMIRYPDDPASPLFVPYFMRFVGDVWTRVYNERAQAGER